MDNPAEPPRAPLGGTRDQTMQRLQIGVAGVVLMLLLVGLAGIIEGRASQTDATAVPAAVPDSAPTQDATQDDPLVEAGVVPDLPTEPTPTAAPAPTQAAVPEADSGEP